MTISWPRAEVVQLRARGFEGGALLFEQLVLGLVGSRKVRIHPFKIEMRAPEQLRQRPCQVFVTKTEAMHAGVDLEVIAHPDVTIAGGRLQCPASRGTRDGGRQIVDEHPVEIADAERAEHENARTRPRFAQLDALLDVSDRQPAGARLLERTRDADGAVAVGIGFDDRDDAGGIGRSAAIAW